MSFSTKPKGFIDLSRFRKEILEEDSTLCLPNDDDEVIDGLSIKTSRWHISRTPPVEGLLERCCTPTQQFVTNAVFFEERDPVDVARDLTRVSGEMVHPTDVCLALEIAFDNLRFAHVCGQ